MASKKDKDLSAGQKLLKMYQLLFAENKKHYQVDLAKKLNCSMQTIIRLANEIEQSCPHCFQSGIENRRKWYSLQAKHPNNLGLDYQELHYLSLCQELSKAYIPQEVNKRLDDTILKLSTLLLEYDSELLKNGNKPFAFFSKGKIDYSNHSLIIQQLINCIKDDYFCHVVYTADNKPNGKNHYFVPKKLIAMNNALYIYGASANNAGTELINTMCLAIHRIKKLDLIKQKVSLTIPEPNPNTFGLPWHEPKIFEIHFKQKVANYIKERIWSDDQKIEELENGDIILTITTCSEPELLAWVRSFGDNSTKIHLAVDSYGLLNRFLSTCSTEHESKLPVDFVDDLPNSQYIFADKGCGIKAVQNKIRDKKAKPAIHHKKHSKTRNADID